MKRGGKISLACSVLLGISIIGKVCRRRPSIRVGMLFCTHLRTTDLLRFHPGIQRYSKPLLRKRKTQIRGSAVKVVLLYLVDIQI